VVIRTLDKMGIASVAVYSEADAQSQHVAKAGEAVRLGSSAASESYLRGPTDYRSRTGDWGGSDSSWIRFSQRKPGVRADVR